jgi:hypothetical protein
MNAGLASALKEKYLLDMNDETEVEKALRLELASTKSRLEISNQIRESEQERHKQNLAQAKEAGKFYNSEGFWLLFWIVGPLILLALGFNIG